MIKLEHAIKDISYALDTVMDLPYGWHKLFLNNEPQLIKQIAAWKWLTLDKLDNGSIHVHHYGGEGENVHYVLQTDGWVETAASRQSKNMYQERQQELRYPAENALAEVGQLVIALQTLKTKQA